MAGKAEENKGATKKLVLACHLRALHPEKIGKGLRLW